MSLIFFLVGIVLLAIGWADLLIGSDFFGPAALSCAEPESMRALVSGHVMDMGYVAIVCGFIREGLRRIALAIGTA